ncbi:Pr6Pr family membrane protein [Citricoccus nitrophenolicus]|uniref:Pr6Pr family membrane protein n=1 Tax=Citricoccus nitrophenolicus TaxID=863575 RepID=UPI0039B6CA2A
MSLRHAQARPRGTAAGAPGWWAVVGRGVFAVAALLSFTGNGLSFSIGSWKDSDLPANAGFSGGFTAGWEHMVNQPTYFTFLANFLVGLTSLLLAIRPYRTSDLFHALRIAAVVSIVITGVVFNVLLRDAPPATPVEQVNDTIQHIITPILTPVVWLLFDPPGGVRWRRIGLASAIPLAWLAFTLLRGPLLDWYPYTILDVPRLGYGGVGVYVVAILAFFFAVAALMWVLDRLLARWLPEVSVPSTP